jgi:hypothetical protein
MVLAYSLLIRLAQIGHIIKMDLLGPCKLGNEPLGSIQGGIFHD